MASEGAVRREVELTSTANPRVRTLVGLRRRRAREQSGLTIVDGREELLMALAAGTRPREVYYCPELATSHDTPHDAHLHDAHLHDAHLHDATPQGPAARGATPYGATPYGASPQDAGARGATLRGAAARGASDGTAPDVFSVDEALLTRVAGLGAEVVRVNRRVFERIAYREGPDGWLAVVPAVDTRLDRLQMGASPLVLVCESVEKPGNLGAMLRTADAAGLDAVIAADPIADWGNPNIVRASKGAVFSVPVAEASGADTLAWLRSRQIAVVVTTPDTDLLYTDVDLRGPTAVVVGTEKYGLTQRWLAEADHRVRIPMHGHIDSLNVATSAALVLYEALRQRTR
jgi:TrmH family RNA methyltransferase